MRASLRAAGSVTLSTLSVLYRGSGWLHVESGPCHSVHAARECTGPATIVFLLESYLLQPQSAVPPEQRRGVRTSPRSAKTFLLNEPVFTEVRTNTFPGVGGRPPTPQKRSDRRLTARQQTSRRVLCAFS